MDKKRFESEIENVLEKQDTTFEGLSLQEKALLKKALEVNDEAHSGQLDADIINFFKPGSTDLDQSIFEVDRWLR